MFHHDCPLFLGVGLLYHFLFWDLFHVLQIENFHFFLFLIFIFAWLGKSCFFVQQVPIYFLEKHKKVISGALYLLV